MTASPTNFETQIAIVGGGPAGLIAAEVLATAGLAVTVYEHKRSVGRKFLLAGRGGLNITHAEPIEALLDRYGEARRTLEPAIRRFSPDSLREWCAELGESTFEGTSHRVFPESFRATPLLRAWLNRLDQLGVSIQTGHRWHGWAADGFLLFEADERERRERPVATVFALGGASWPRVGSNGAWLAPFETNDIVVAPLVGANCGVEVTWSAVIGERFAGEPLKNVVLRVGQDVSRGDVIVTERGLEGGPVYAVGPGLRERLSAGLPATLRIDLAPDLDLARLTARLAKRRPKASTSSWVKAAGLSPVAIALAREATQNNLPQDANSLAGLLKALPLTVPAMAPIGRAISTAGGVSLDEINADFMLTSLPGTFIAGEMLDWEAPTGGYLLQACFSTGVAAAEGVLKWLDGDRVAVARVPH